MHLVCLDSHYYVWSILEHAKPDQLEKIPKAKELFQYLAEKKTVIVVPTPLVTELLMEADEGERDTMLTRLESDFFIKEMDLAIAQKAAEIWNTKKRLGVIDEIREKGLSMKTKIKVDTLILATAMVTGCTTLYTEDKDMTKLAAGSIITRKMEGVLKQPDLFQMMEAAKDEH